jgi:hypothetical protein
MFIAILIAWNLPVLRDIIAGLKVRPTDLLPFTVLAPPRPDHPTPELSYADQQLFVVATHELCHLTVGLLCGGQVVSICIDPNDGGATHIMGLMRQYPRVPRDPYAMPTYPQLFWSPALATLAAGYIGSSIVGFLFVVCLF